MVLIKSDTEQNNLNQFLKTKGDNFQGIWLGMTDVMSPGDLKWIDNDYVSYQNWAYGEPESTLSQYPGGTCAGQPALDNWVTERCGERNRFGYACEKLKGNNTA